MNETKCRLCGCHEMQKLYMVKGHTITKCKRCNLVQVPESNNSISYDYNDDYFTSSKYLNNKCQNHENSRRLKLLNSYMNRCDRILDFGCATGDFVLYARDYYDIEGADVSPNAIAIGAKRNIELLDKIFVASSTDISALNHKYNAICVWDVLEHVHNPKQLIIELLNALEKDGVLLISTPNIGALFAKIMKRSWPFMTPPEHVSFFSKRSINFLAKSTNCEILDWSSRGKWVNLAFLLYKMQRIIQNKTIEHITKLVKSSWLRNINLYVPSNDIQYIVLKKLA